MTSLRGKTRKEVSDEDDEDISFDVREGFSVNIYVDNDLVYGPIEGGCRVTIM